MHLHSCNVKVLRDPLQILHPPNLLGNHFLKSWLRLSVEFRRIAFEREFSFPVLLNKLVKNAILNKGYVHT